MTADYDICVIGGGPAGIVAAVRARWVKRHHALPCKVAIVEPSTLGGLAAMGSTTLTGMHFVMSPEEILERLRGDVIVNVASSLGEQSLPCMGAYAASKAGILSLTRTLALELAPALRVNAVGPGPVATRMTMEGLPKVARAMGVSEDVLQKKLMQGFPTGQLSTVDDVAKAVLFLCGPASSNVTGQVIRVDGGWRM